MISLFIFKWCLSFHSLAKSCNNCEIAWILFYGEWCKLWKASPFTFPLCSGAVRSLSFQQENIFFFFSPFLFICSPLLMKFAWEHTLCFVLELVFSLSAHSHSVYLCTLLQRAKAAKGHREDKKQEQQHSWQVKLTTDLCPLSQEGERKSNFASP